MVEVWTYTSSQDWVQHGESLPVTFVNGDQLGARATASGQVSVFKNGQILGTGAIDITSWPYYDDGGYIGLWMVTANEAVLDDYGGGSLGGDSFSGMLDPNESSKKPIIPVSEWLKLHRGAQGVRKGMARLVNMRRGSFVTRPRSSPLEIGGGETITITYTYDSLYRLTAADYSDDTYFHYTYDSVGNRLTEQTQTGSTSYGYDIANRLTSVNEVSYTWDDNGNLLSDGAITYTYNHANRLVSASGGGYNASYGYNGSGDRVRQTVNGVTTNYTLDLATGLTQVLEDGTETYLYGSERIAQYGANAEYFLGDALGSVRQLADNTGAVTLVKSFQPYGSTLNNVGEGVTNYGFTGEWVDSNIGMVYLRARYYDAYVGRFVSQDIWDGIPNKPLTYNKWLYAYSNPVLFVDRTGLEATVDCGKILFSDMRLLCEEANGNDDDPNVLDARYQFFWKIANLSKLLSITNNGFWWAGDMLQHFLSNGGYRNVALPYGTSFASDHGIRRAIIEILPRKFTDEPQEILPLLHVFLRRLKQNIGCEKFQVVPRQEVGGEGTYSDQSPRPQSLGWWGAFGHVAVNAEYSNINIFPTYGNNGYVVKTKVKYLVNDSYEWFGGQMLTPLPLGTLNWDADYFPPVDLVYIPHEWEDSLVSAGLASEYDFSITWSEYMQIIVLKDFSNFLIVGEGKWQSLK